MNEHIINEKITLRQKCREIRGGFGEEFIIEASMAACELLASTSEFKTASTLLIYFPINNEISPLPLFELAKKLGKVVAFPVCDHETGTLIFRAVSELNSLVKGKFGLLEPSKSCETVSPDKDTLCIVPSLALSRNGARLGYGKGFYDRFLCNFEGVCAGFTYSELLFDSIPSEMHDSALNMIITESEVLCPNEQN